MCVCVCVGAARASGQRALSHTFSIILKRYSYVKYVCLLFMSVHVNYVCIYVCVGAAGAKGQRALPHARAESHHSGHVREERVSGQHGGLLR